MDALRGFALCGILFVNIMWFKAPGGGLGTGYEGTSLDRATVAAVTALAQGKFFTLFSFLFGWGFATQLLRSEARGAEAGFAPLFLRRLLILGLIGVAHVVLLSEGDILLFYALIGLLLLPLRHTPPEILLRSVKWLLAVPAVVWLLLFGALALGRTFPDGAAEIAVADRETKAMFLADASDDDRLSRSGLRTRAEQAHRELRAQRMAPAAPRAGGAGHVPARTRRRSSRPDPAGLRTSPSAAAHTQLGAGGRIAAGAAVRRRYGPVANHERTPLSAAELGAGRPAPGSRLRRLDHPVVASGHTGRGGCACWLLSAGWR